MLPFASFPVVFSQILIISSPLLLFMCTSKKKFETDARAELVPRTPKSPLSPHHCSSQSSQPTTQTPPQTTPIEKSGRREEDTLANVQSLQPEISDGPAVKKKK